MVSNYINQVKNDKFLNLMRRDYFYQTMLLVFDKEDLRIKRTKLLLKSIQIMFNDTLFYQLVVTMVKQINQTI